MFYISPRMNRLILFVLLVCTIKITQAQKTNKFVIWATADSHIGTDAKNGRKSLERAIRQSEGGIEGYPCFKWDIMLHLGDIAGSQGAPDNAEGNLVKEQLHAAIETKREDIYNLMGNHDASALRQPNHWWFEKWVDPFGVKKAYSGVDSNKRKYKLNGNIDRYYIESGNILIIMLSDENQGPTPWGRANKQGGYPAGRIELETFNWWKNLVETNQDKIIITCAHHMLRNTTTASDYGEGIQYGMHGYRSDGAPQGSSYLYFVGDEANSNKFHDYFAAHPGAIDFWLGGHTHLNIEKTYGGKKMIEKHFGVTFINVSALTNHHNNSGANSTPMSRILQFTEGSDTALVSLYLHDPVNGHKGISPLHEYRATLRKKARPLIDTSTSYIQRCPKPKQATLIYPNPVHQGQNIEILFDSLPERTEIQLIDIMGRKLFQQIISPDQTENHISLDTKFYKKGIYFLRMKTDNNQKVEKILII